MWIWTHRPSVPVHILEANSLHVLPAIRYRHQRLSFPMKTRIHTGIQSEGATEIPEMPREVKDVPPSSAKRLKLNKSPKPSISTNIIKPWTNLQTEVFIETLGIEDVATSLPTTPECSIQTVASRYSKKYQESMMPASSSNTKLHAATGKNRPKTVIKVSTKDQRSSGRLAVSVEHKNIPEQYKVDDTSMGFSWWSNSIQDDCLTQKAYNKSSMLMLKGFNGEIALTTLAGPHLAYAFVVPFYTQIGMMTAFKSLPNQKMIRERMKELSSMKTCYYTQLHWKKGAGNASHVNESDWRDNPLLDPTSSLLLDAYMSSLSAAISSATGWKIQYNTLCSLIETEKAGHQAPHVDDKGCFEKEEHFKPYILHHPLCEEGSSLQIWLPNNKGSHSPTLVHIPFGTALILRGDVYHAGSYGNPGNLRFHAHLSPVQSTADGRELGLLNVDRNERLRETDLAAGEVNNILLQKNKQHCKFTAKYMKRMKMVLPVSSFWGQQPEKNATGKQKRTEYS